MTGPRILVSYSDSEAQAMEQFESRLRALDVTVLRDSRPRLAHESEEPGSEEPGSDFHVILVSSHWFAGQLLPEIEDVPPHRLQVIALDDKALTRCRQLRFQPWCAARRAAFNDPAFWAWLVERFRITTNIEFLAPKAVDPGEIVSALDLFVGRRTEHTAPRLGATALRNAPHFPREARGNPGHDLSLTPQATHGAHISDTDDVGSALDLFVGARPGAAWAARAGTAGLLRPPRRFCTPKGTPAPEFDELAYAYRARRAEPRTPRFDELSKRASLAAAAEPSRLLTEMGPSIASVVLASALLAATPAMGPLALIAGLGLVILLDRTLRGYLGRVLETLTRKLLSATERLALLTGNSGFALLGYAGNAARTQLTSQDRRRLRQLEKLAQLLEARHRSSELLIDNLKWEADGFRVTRDRLALLQNEYAGAISAVEEIFRNTLEFPEFRYRRVREVVIVDADFTASVARDYEIEAGPEPVRMFPISIAPDQNAQTVHFLSEIDFKVRPISEASDKTLRYLLFDNAFLKKQIVLFFLPAIDPGENRRFRISYRWPRFSGDLAAFGRTTFYTTYRTGSENDRANIRYELRVARSLGPLECAKMEDSGGGGSLEEEHTDLYWVWRYDNPEMPTKAARLAFEVRVAGAKGDELSRIRTLGKRNTLG